MPGVLYNALKFTDTSVSSQFPHFRHRCKSLGDEGNRKGSESACRSQQHPVLWFVTQRPLRNTTPCPRPPLIEFHIGSSKVFFLLPSDVTDTEMQSEKSISDA